MPVSQFTVIAILPGRRADYFATWAKGVRIAASGSPLVPNALFVSVEVEARSKADAEAKVRQRYPNHAIDQAATVRRSPK